MILTLWITKINCKTHTLHFQVFSLAIFRQSLCGVLSCKRKMNVTLILTSKMLTSCQLFWDQLKLFFDKQLCVTAFNLSLLLPCRDIIFVTMKHLLHHEPENCQSNWNGPEGTTMSVVSIVEAVLRGAVKTPGPRKVRRGKSYKKLLPGLKRLLSLISLCICLWIKLQISCSVVLLIYVLTSNVLELITVTQHGHVKLLVLIC